MMGSKPKLDIRRKLFSVHGSTLGQAAQTGRGIVMLRRIHEKCRCGTEGHYLAGMWLWWLDGWAG